MGCDETKASVNFHVDQPMDCTYLLTIFRFKIDLKGLNFAWKTFTGLHLQGTMAKNISC